MRHTRFDAHKPRDRMGMRSPARNIRSPEIITNVEILQVARALVRVDY